RDARSRALTRRAGRRSACTFRYDRDGFAERPMTFAPVRPGARVFGLCALSIYLAATAAAAQQIGPRLAPGEPIPPAELEAFIDGAVTTAMAEHRIVGVTVAAVQGGQIVLEKGYGFADLEARRRVDPAATLFRIGSITKTFTWIEIMRLVEAG